MADIKGLDLSNIPSGYSDGVERVIDVIEYMQWQNKNSNLQSFSFSEFLEDAYCIGADKMNFLISEVYGSSDSLWGIPVLTDDLYEFLDKYDEIFKSDQNLADTYFNYAISQGMSPEKFICEFLELQKQREDNFKDRFLKKSSKTK